MKKNTKKLIALTLCTGLIITCTQINDFKSITVNAKAASTHKTQTGKITAKERKGEGTGTAYKNETVFVTTDPTGKTTSILVSDWLKNEKKYQTITDITNLKSLENVKGNEKLNRKGSDLSIEANGSDIYYRGTLSADTQLPVSLTISYQLDGKDISVENLKGASGKLNIVIHYTNQTATKQVINGKEYQVCVPFIASTVLMIPSEQLSNFDIKNGKVIESGEMDLIIGYGLPGMNQSLNLTDGPFTDTVEINATVKDYNPSMLMTYLSSEPFASSDLKDAVDINSLQSSIQSTTQNSALLGNMSNINDFNQILAKMEESFQTLNSGAIELTTGIAKVDANIELLKSGLKDAQSGSSLLSETMNSVYTKSNELSKGASSLDAGIQSLSAALNGMYDSISSSISKNNSDLAQVNAGIAALSSILSPTAAQLAQLATLKGNQAALAGANQALSTIKAQMDQGKLLANLNQLLSGSAQIKSGALALSTGLGTISSKTKDLTAGITKLHNGAVLLKDGTSQLLSGSHKLSDGTSLLASSMNGNVSDLLNRAKAIQAAAKEYKTFTQLSKEGNGKVSFIIKSE